MPKISENLKESKKRHLLKIASQLFIDKGYSKTSVNDIVKEAEVSKGNFYTYYDSKESLFFDIVHGEDGNITHFGDVIDIDGDQNILGGYIDFRLRRLMQEDNRKRAKYTYEFMSTMTLTPAQVTVMKNRYKDFLEDVSRLIKLSQKRGYYRDDLELDSFVHVFLATIEGLIVMDSILCKEIDEEVIEMTIHVMNGYLQKKRG